MTWIGQLDVLVLGGMLAYVVAVVVLVSYHRHAALHAEGIDTAHAANRENLIADVGIHVANLKSISSAAPFLGLVGTCLGILSTFRGYSGPPEGFVVMVASGMSSALMTTVAGLLVAIPATWAHNYARTCIDSLLTKLTGAPALKDDTSLVARRLPLTKRFSQLPAYALIAAPSLAIGVAAFAMFASFRATVGLVVEVAPPACQKPDRLIVLHLNDAGKLFINFEPVDQLSLPDRLGEIYGKRAERNIYLVVDDGVPFQSAAEVIDMVRNTPFPTLPGQPPTPPELGSHDLKITVSLVTPSAKKGRCPAPVLMP